MRPPFIERRSRPAGSRKRERGVTMALVAIAMVGVIAMAAVSIDIGTLYQASAEAQRSADAAALAAARTISMSGLTTDPTPSDWSPICGGGTSQATQAAIATAQQNSVAGASNLTVTVTYSANGGASAGSDCTAVGTAFATNPLVTVTVQQSNMAVYFLRLWGTTTSSVSATATAEAFNASSPTGVASMVSYATWPRCVKPWVVPNLDPDHANPAPQPFITGGAIQNSGTFPSGVIGETFTLMPDCTNTPSGCTLSTGQPKANAGSLQYVPGQVSSTITPTAIPACSSGGSPETLSPYAQAIAGCDQSTQYRCGVTNANDVDLATYNPIYPGSGSGDTTDGAQCLIHQAAASGNGQDALAAATPGVPPPNYPFQIQAGSSNPIVGEGLSSGSTITSSTSIVTVPIYNQNGSTLASGAVTQVTIIGFLQVFINYVDGNGDVNVTVMNVVGCSPNPSPSTVFNGTSPVPVRLITH